MRFVLQEHDGYFDGALVHRVTEVICYPRKGEDPYTAVRYHVACKGEEFTPLNVRNVDKPVTCLECLGVYQKGFLKCTKYICPNRVPVHEMWVHPGTGRPYCSPCARHINNTYPNSVVIQS